MLHMSSGITNTIMEFVPLKECRQKPTLVG